jgi:hypothetical protein
MRREKRGTEQGYENLRLASLYTEIWTSNLPNSMQECSPLDNDARFKARER